MEKTKSEALADLREMMPEGSTVYTIWRGGSASNMTNWYSLVVFVDGHPLHPNYSASIVTTRTMKSVKGFYALKAGGCGYDRARSIVDDIAWELYGSEKALRQEAL